MAHCPLCQARIADDFGLLECNSCGAQLLVHMDGKIEYSGENKNADGTPANEDEAPHEYAELEEADENYSKTTLLPDTDTPLESSEDPDLQPNEPLPTNDPGDRAIALDSPDLSDVAAFGNSSESGAKSGALRYNLMITGIDTADMREVFRQALTDRRFVWDTEEILRSLKNGQVKIPNVAAAKAFILISNLRNLPVKVRWEQYAIHQS